MLLLSVQGLYFPDGITRYSILAQIAHLGSVAGVYALALVERFFLSGFFHSDFQVSPGFMPRP